jgi:hypothetical protein
MSTKRKGFDGDLAVHNGGSRIHHFPKRKSIRRTILALVITAILFIAYIHHKGVTYNVEESILHYLSLTNEEQARLHDHQLASLAAGLKQCININQRPISGSDKKRTNPRAVRSVSPQIIKNATLIDGDGSILAGKSILLSEGVIKQIDHDMDYPKEAKIIDAGGRYISPGLVDMVPPILKYTDGSILMQASIRFQNFLESTTQMKLVEMLPRMSEPLTLSIPPTKCS